MLLLSPLLPPLIYSRRRSAARHDSDASARRPPRGRILPQWHEKRDNAFSVVDNPPRTQREKGIRESRCRLILAPVVWKVQYKILGSPPPSILHKRLPLSVPKICPQTFSKNWTARRSTENGAKSLIAVRDRQWLLRQGRRGGCCIVRRE